MIELRHLRYFVAVAETLHFGRAARRLHISQPPLSRQIQQLEAHLGVELFHRQGRNVALTDAGRCLLADAEAILARVMQAETNAVRAARGEVGRIRLGFVSPALYSRLPALARQVREHLPQVALELREMTADAQYRGIETEAIDAGLVICPSQTPDLLQRRIHCEALVACLPADHPLAAGPRRRPIPVAALRDEDFIMFPRAQAPGLHDRIIAVGERNGFALRFGQPAVQMQTIVGLVSARLGVAIVPASIANLRRAGVVYRQLTPAPEPVSTMLLWARQNRSAVLARVLALWDGAAAGN